MVRASLTFGSPAAAAADQSPLDFANANQLTAIGQNAFKGTAFQNIDLSTSTSLQTIGPDAFSAIIGLTKVTMSPDQAQVVNPGVFSGADSAGGQFTISLQGNQSTYSAPSSLGPTLTPSSNLNRFASTITTIDLSAAPITTLAGPVLFGNDKIEKLVLPATATNWQLTNPTDYTTSPIGGVTASQGLATSGQGIEFTNFGQSTNTAATSFDTINWALVASILNMFGRVEAGKDTNLAIWSEGKWDRELTAESVKQGWTKGSEAKQGEGQELNQSSSSATKTVNGVEWTYKKEQSSGPITLTASPNAYKAGYAAYF